MVFFRLPIICCFSLQLVAFPAQASQKVSSQEHAQRADQLMSSGQVHEARKEYSKAIEHDHKNPLYYQERARADIQLKKHDSTVNDLSKSLKYNASDPNTYAARAKAYEASHKYKKAIKDIDKLLEIQPNYAPALLERASANEELKNWSQVLEDTDKAASQHLERDQYAAVYKLRAEAFRKLGHTQEADAEQAKVDSLSGTSTNTGR